MPLAWTTVCVLLLLLPGLTFFVGLHTSRSITRETRPRSITTELAWLVLAAFCVHVLLLAILWALGRHFAGFDIDLASALAVVVGPDPQAMPAARIARNVNEHAPLIVFYVLCSAGLGLVIGASTARWGRRHLGRFLRHSWVQDCTPSRTKAEITYAHVLTKVRPDGRALAYRGILTHFGLTDDGRFSYLLLRNPRRFYIRLAEGAPTTADSRAIGATRFPDEKHDRDLLHIDGGSIENVVLVPRPLPAGDKQPRTVEEWESFVAGVVAKMGKVPPPTTEPPGTPPIAPPHAPAP